MRSNRRQPQAERREQIADAALEILGRQGLAGLTTTALADAIGVSSGALFRHFASRNEILEETVRQAADRVDATFPDASLPPAERLRALALARVALISTQPGIAWLLRSTQALQALPPTAVQRLRGLIRRSRSYIRRALRAATEAGDVRTDVPPDVLLLVYTATVHALTPRGATPAKRARSASPKTTIDGLLALLAPPPPPSNRS